jgi:hypothetical protein
MLYFAFAAEYSLFNVTCARAPRIKDIEVSSKEEKEEIEEMDVV